MTDVTSADASNVQADLSLVLERITDGFFALDQEWRIAYMNSEARKLLSPRGHVIGQFWLDVFPKARGRLFEREYHRAMSDQRPVQFIEYSTTANCWFECKAYPSPDGVSVYFRDVTSRIEAEREVERNARRQEALVDFGRSALASASFGAIMDEAVLLIREVLDAPIVEIYGCDADGENLRARRAFGWGLHTQFDPAHRPLTHVRHAISTGEAFVCSDVRIDSRAPDAAAFASRGVLSCLTASIGTPAKPIGAVVAYYPRPRTFSVNEIRFAEALAHTLAEASSVHESNRRVRELNAQLEARVAQRTKQLELANKELESFSYSVSHDLRAPLRAIDGFSQALVEDYDQTLDDRGRNYLDRVRKAAQRMSDLIDALLGLASVARASMTMGPVDISLIAERIAGDLQAGDAGRVVDVEIEAGMHARGEGRLLQAVLENLVGNAWKFTRHTAEPRIVVGRSAQGEFFVRDNGAGFDMTYANKLFGAFQRLHSADEYEGTGIGLATVARIVHRHGGTIRAEGAVGEGATFYFRLPESNGVRNGD